MENFKVKKSFYSIKDQKGYNVGEVVSLSKEDAERLLRNDLIENNKSSKSKK